MGGLKTNTIFEKIHGVDVLTNPQLIIEILSDSTEKFDRDAKFKHYKSIESFREYLLISQDTPFVTQYVLHNEKFWVQTLQVSWGYSQEIF